MTIREHCYEAARRGYIGDLSLDVEIRKACDGMAQCFQAAVDLGAITEANVLFCETWPELLAYLKFACDAVREVVPDELKQFIPQCPTINQWFGDVLGSR